MSQTADTVENILQRVSDLRGESSINTDAVRIRHLSEAERIFAGRNLWKVHLLRDQTETGDGTSEYTIGTTTYPMRSKGLTEVFVGGTTEDKRHVIVDYSQYKALYNRSNGVKAVYEWYDQENDLWKMHVNPAPSVGDAITYSYYYMPPTRTLTTDMVVCPDINAVTKHLLGLVYQAEEELGLSNQYKGEAEQIISELQALDNMPAKGQLYQQGAIENQVRTRGYGSY